LYFFQLMCIRSVVVNQIKSKYIIHFNFSKLQLALLIIHSKITIKNTQIFRNCSITKFDFKAIILLRTQSIGLQSGTKFATDIKVKEAYMNKLQI